jgi:hypothetical protein
VRNLYLLPHQRLQKKLLRPPNLLVDLRLLHQGGQSLHRHLQRRLLLKRLLHLRLESLLRLLKQQKLVDLLPRNLLHELVNLNRLLLLRLALRRLRLLRETATLLPLEKAREQLLLLLQRGIATQLLHHQSHLNLQHRLQHLPLNLHL